MLISTIFIFYIFSYSCFHSFIEKIVLYYVDMFIHTVKGVAKENLFFQSVTHQL